MHFARLKFYRYKGDKDLLYNLIMINPKIFLVLLQNKKRVRLSNSCS